ncbi:MAG: MFS transporter, partial [Novosphingobium sp.]
LAIWVVLPEIGKIYDKAKVAKAGGEDAFKALQAGTPEMHAALAHAAEVSFKTISVVPVILFFIFGAVWLFERGRVTK